MNCFAKVARAVPASATGNTPSWLKSLSRAPLLKRLWKALTPKREGSEINEKRRSLFEEWIDASSPIGVGRQAGTAFLQNIRTAASIEQPLVQGDFKLVEVLSQSNGQTDVDTTPHPQVSLSVCAAQRLVACFRHRPLHAAAKRSAEADSVRG